jgi:hypothetical protein
VNVNSPVRVDRSSPIPPSIRHATLFPIASSGTNAVTTPVPKILFFVRLGRSLPARRQENYIMKSFILAALAAAALSLPSTVFAGPNDNPAAAAPSASTDSIGSADSAAAYPSTFSFLSSDPIYADAAQPSATPQKGPPLPFHDIEGFGGGAITPMAYLVNPPLGTNTLGLPSAAVSYVNLGQKDLEAFTITENVIGRVELGFGADRLGLGDLPDDIQKATGVDIHTTDVWLYNFNARGLLIPENSFNSQWVPALTGGVHFKYNDGIANVNNRLGSALDSIGYRKDEAFDFTLTASKTFPNVFGRPLIVSAGGRESEGAQLGFLGFGESYRTTFEGNIAYLPTDWLLVAYEFRQKTDPYGQIPGLIGRENDWHALDVSWIPNAHIDVTAGIGYFGVLANARADSAFWLQLKYEF